MLKPKVGDDGAPSGVGPPCPAGAGYRTPEASPCGVGVASPAPRCGHGCTRSSHGGHTVPCVLVEILVPSPPLLSELWDTTVEPVGGNCSLRDGTAADPGAGRYPQACACAVTRLT